MPLPHVIAACAVLLALLCLGAGALLIWRADAIAAERRRRYLQRAGALGGVPVVGLVIQRRWARREEETGAASFRRPAAIRLAGAIIVLAGLLLLAVSSQ